MSRTSPRWMSLTLCAAAAYNLIWGTWVILRPGDLFGWTGMEPPLYPGIWQCVGMIVGVYGIGYGIAATDPTRHWPIVLVGFLGKVLGPIGMVHNVLTIPPGTPGRLPASWLWLNVSNDLIWWLPFGAILYLTFKQWNLPTSEVMMTIADANRKAVTQSGEDLSTLSQRSNLLVVFLRHSGCTFCREALADLAKNRNQIEAKATVVLVHMDDEDESTARYFAGYGLGDVARVSDPQCVLYRAYQLQRGSFGQLFGPSVWWKGFQAAILSRHAVGKLGGDGFQLGGSFLVRNDQIVRAYRNTTAADRPDYCELASV
ncbi:SelL-related redox protein [Neorhodopirellula pilleata]|uniref:Uncharacterized protein n=1 Tax=Neorhodopirellula pilleata TaxID=2714738 RepID=A0A5C6A862_9BACT|nr:SelL-related redox protein [Neorhodopirellula pilleata]TWT95488.1 hypothetical protein Pla100_31290 [Neorhodopirellula pilleata]